ncbi:MAG: hypothetical protein PVJ15_03510 [Gammaproteobacteria bacterium]|jgi:hypothetical protein
MKESNLANAAPAASALDRRVQCTQPSHPGKSPPAVALSVVFRDATGHVRTTRLQRCWWAVARLSFYTYIGFSMLTLVGGFLTAPLMTQLFFGDWRFWRHWRRGWRLLPHGWGMLRLVVQGEGRYMLDVPLASPPQTGPDHRLVELSPTWEHGSSCGTCRQCCQVLTLRCPVLDTRTGFCSGYNSFYWRYFNCGRYPVRKPEIDYYGCRKWQMKDVLPVITPVAPADALGDTPAP